MTRGQGEGETRRQGDKGRGRQGEEETGGKEYRNRNTDRRFI